MKIVCWLVFSHILFSSIPKHIGWCKVSLILAMDSDLFDLPWLRWFIGSKMGQVFMRIHPQAHQALGQVVSDIGQSVSYWDVFFWKKRNEKIMVTMDFESTEKDHVQLKCPFSSGISQPCLILMFNYQWVYLKIATQNTWACHQLWEFTTGV